MRYVFCVISLFIILLSCKKEDSCTYEELSGNYMFYSETDTSESKIEFYSTPDGFKTTGLMGYEFWFPAAPLSGYLDECNIIINEYNNVKREGLPFLGGGERYYYESLEGHGQFFPDHDSIVLFIHYTRTENWPTDFAGNLTFIKVH